MADCPRLGDVKNRYLQIAQGEGAQQNSEEEENGELVDQKGDKIEKSGGKIEIVKSSDGVGSIRDRFGSIGKGGWKKQNQDGLDTDQVDANAVSSARNLFKNFEQQKQDDQKSFVRPTARKVRDPKELMEERKKATYGGEDELPEDGVVKKSVIIDEEELASGSSSRKEALNVYKELQSSPKDNGVNSKQETNKRSDSMSGSENDGDEASGYGGSDSPCSPTSTMSEDYVSDGQKEHEKGKVVRLN